MAESDKNLNCVDLSKPPGTIEHANYVSGTVSTMPIIDEDRTEHAK